MHNIKTLSRLFLTCFAVLISAKTIVSQNCAGFNINNTPNGVVAYSSGMDLSQYGGYPFWTITIGEQESYNVEGSSILLNNNLLQEIGLENITLCFSWGDGNTECDQTTCATYNYNLSSDQLELLETVDCNASFNAEPGENGQFMFENTSYTEAGNATYFWQTGDESLGFYAVNAEHQYSFSGPATACMTMGVYQENQLVCQDDTCITVDVQLNELNCEPGYTTFYVEVLTCCEAENENQIFFTLNGIDNETSISDVIPVSAEALELSSFEACVPEGCYQIQFDYSNMLQMAQQTSYLAYGSNYMYNEQIIDTFEDLPWNSTFCVQDGNELCPSEIIAQMINCNTFVFEIPGVTEGEVIWNFGDDSEGAASLIADHQFEQNGTYIVTAKYISATCLDGVLLSYVVEVACNDCPENITTLNTNTCGQYIFYVNNAGPNAQIVWYPGDGNEPVTTSGEFVHAFENAGNYEVCAMAYTSGCPSGTEICTVIEVAECNSNDCPNNIAVEQIDCNTFLFNINDNNTGYAIWNFGDGTNNFDYQGNPEHTYSGNGIYVVTAEYFGPGCQSGVNLIVTVVSECADEICPETITITEGQLCHQYIFEVNNWGESIYGEILWNFGDNEGYGQNEFLHMYMQPGNYEVCVEGSTEQCPGGFAICTPLHVDACGGDSNDDGCPDWIWGYPVNDCGLWYFEAGIFESENQNVLWNWGDGTFSDNSTIAEHQYTEDGIYIVTLTYSSDDCDESTVIYTVEANACETPDCPQEIWSGPGDACGVMMFEAGGYVEGENFIWYFGDGTQAEGGHFITHTYSEPGIYNVCCVLSNVNCPGYQLCSEITVEDCNPECTNVIFGIDSYVNDGGTPALGYTIFNSNNEMITYGVAEYTEQDPYFDFPLCLPDGCYYLTVDNNNNIILGDGVNVFITAGNENLMQNATIVYQDDISFTILFGLNSNCTETDDCEAHFEHLYNTTPGLISFINNSVANANTTCTWDFGNGLTSTEWSPQFQFTANGVYEVCLTITDGNCTDTFCHNVVIENIPALCADNLVEITFTGDFNSNTQELIEILISQDDIPVEDWTLLYSNQQESLTAELCLPDGCYEFSFSATSQIQAEELNLNIVSNGATISNIDLPINETTGNAIFGLDTDCTIAIEDIAIEHELVMFPIPADEMISLQQNATENLTVNIYSLSGQLVYSSKTNNQLTVINTAQWAEGLYIAKIMTPSGIKSQRFEIIH